MGNIGKAFLFLVKEQLKKREREFKRNTQEKVRLDRKNALDKGPGEQRKRFEVWQKKEDSWKGIFSGKPIEPKDWNQALEARPFVAPDKPESDYLLGQALLSVKMRFKPLLYFTLTVAGVFLYGFAVTEYPEDLWLYGIVGSSSALASLGLLGWRKIAMKKAEEKVISYKRYLEEEYKKKQESALREHEDREQRRIASIKALLNGETEAIEKWALDHLVDVVNWPLGVTFRTQGISADVLELTIDVPGLEMINQEYASWDETKGNVTFSTKSPQEALKHYERLISAMLLRAATEVFAVCPTIEEIYTSIVTTKHHRTTGQAYEACILSAVVTKADIVAIDFAHVEYMPALEKFKLRYSPRPLELPGDVLPFRAQEGLAHDAKGLEPVSETPSELLYLDLNDLNALSGEQFEDVVKDLVVRMGFVAEKTQPSHDGGIDIWAYSDNALNGGRYIIQCKRWSSTVPVETVRDLYGTLMREKADGGILITTSDISSDGQKFIAEAHHTIPLKLIGGSQLKSLLNEHGMAK